MDRTHLLWAALLLGIVGLLDSLYLAHAQYTLNPLTCNLLDGCNIVAQSAYSKIFGIPLSYLGVLYYIGMLKAVSWMLFPHLVEKFGFPPAFFVRLGYKVFISGAFIGAVASAIFVYIQVAYIQAFCMYCIVSAVVTFLFALLTVLYQRFSHTNTEQPVV